MHHYRSPSGSRRLQDGFRVSIANANMCEMDFPFAGTDTDMALESVRVDALTVSRYQSTGPQQVRRRPDHIRRDGLDSFIVTLPLSAEFHFSQRSNECSVSPGSFALISTSRPFTIVEIPHSAGRPLTSLHVVIPGPLLREQCMNADAICSRALPIRSGAGQMMRSLIAAWLQDGATLTISQASKASDLLVDLVATASGQAGDDRKLILPITEKSRKDTLHIATRFIAASLSNPQLNTSLVAAHCNVSVRYLQKAFESASMSVAGFIREKRLQRCHEALISCDLQHYSIMQIAQLWGFGEPSQFSRAYKNIFGISPLEERRRSRPRLA